MARTSPARRPLAGALGALGLLLLAGCATVPVTSSGPAPTSTSGDEVIVCDSGVVSSGGIETSSAVAYRASAGTPAPVGCRVG